MSECQLTAESAECRRTRGSNHLPSREAPATVTEYQQHRSYFDKLHFRTEAKTIDSIDAMIGPLSKLLGRLCERHIWRHGTVHQSLRKYSHEAIIIIPHCKLVCTN